MLQKLRKGASEQSIENEFQTTKTISEVEADIETLSFRLFFTDRTLWWPLILSINLHLSQQLGGIGAVMYYASEVMIVGGADGKGYVLATRFFIFQINHG